MPETNGKHDLILDLDQFVESHGRFTLKKKSYEYVWWDGLSILEQKRIIRDWNRIQAIETGEDIDLADMSIAEEHVELLRRCVVAISSMTIEEAGAMPPVHMGRCITGFFGWVGLVQKDAAMKIVGVLGSTITMSPIGEKYSSDSTDDGPKKTRASG